LGENGRGHTYNCEHDEGSFHNLLIAAIEFQLEKQKQVMPLAMDGRATCAVKEHEVKVDRALDRSLQMSMQDGDSVTRLLLFWGSMDSGSAFCGLSTRSLHIAVGSRRSLCVGNV
jgi:hypothetical protein